MAILKALGKKYKVKCCFGPFASNEVPKVEQNKTYAKLEEFGWTEDEIIGASRKV